MHCSCFQAGKKAQPPFLSRFSVCTRVLQNLRLFERRVEGETKPCFREWRHDLTGWLASSSLTFNTFTIPLANLLTCGDDPKSLGQLTKGEIYSSGMISSLMIVLHN